MFKLDDGIMFCYLTFLSVVDIKRRKIPLSWLLLGGVLMFVIKRLIYPASAFQTFLGIVIGMLFLLLSKLTNEAIGEGDGILILIIGIACGGSYAIFAIIIACMLLCMVGAVVKIRAKVTRKTQLPFYPFLTVGCILCQVLSR